MMRRYRKGQTFRPPTVAESAAHADTAEAFRSRPEAPQPRLPRGVDIVKTPLGGIPARDGEIISSAICTRCVEISGAYGTKTLVETDEELCVYNLDTNVVPGGIYVVPDLTIGGMLCIGPSETDGAPVIQFRVLSAGPFEYGGLPECENAIRVTASVIEAGCAGATVEIGDRVQIWDPRHCHFDLPMEMLVGAVGTAVSMQNTFESDYGTITEYCAEYDDLLEEGACRWVVTGLSCCEEIYGCD